MKTPFLILALSVCLVAPNANAEGRPGGFRDSMRQLGHSLTHSDPKKDHHFRDGIRETGEDIRDSFNNRPRSASYIALEKSKDGKKVDLYYCDAKFKRILENKDCEKLNKAAMDPEGLQSCLSTARDNTQNAGYRIAKNIDKLMERDVDARFFHLWDIRRHYAEYTETCEAKLAKAAPSQPKRRVATPPAPAPVPAPAPAPAPVPEEFKPLDGEAKPFDVPLGDTL